MKSSQKISPLLDLEDTPEILSFKTKNGMLIWPPLRYLILGRLYNSRFGLSELAPGSGVDLLLIRKLIVTLILHNPLKILFKRRVRNLFIYSSVSNFKTNGFYFNRVADYFFLLFNKDSYCLETLYNKELNRPRAHNKVTYALALNGLARILVNFRIVRLTKRETQQLFHLFTLLAQRSENSFTQELANIRESAANALCVAKAQYSVYDVFFKFSSIKRLIIEDAAYGGNSFIQYAAKKNGIKVIEPQHGAVTNEHLGYNFGGVILKSIEYKQYLPDYFLSYGEYWNEQINLPTRKIAIGNPFLNDYLNNSKKKKTKTNQILLISPGTTKEETAFVAMSLLQHLGQEYIIKLRPHPLEKFQAAEKYKSLLDAGLTLDKTPNVYDSIVESDCIIGDISTVLFEAIAFQKITISYNSRINPPVTFPENLVHITDLEEVAQKARTLLCNKQTASFSDPSYVWQTDWEPRFNSLMKELENCEVL